MNQIEQTDCGKFFLIAYSDDGNFATKVFDNTGKVLDTHDVSKALELDNFSKPVYGFYEPLIVACFLPENNVFIAAYHRM